MFCKIRSHEVCFSNVCLCHFQLFSSPLFTVYMLHTVSASTLFLCLYLSHCIIIYIHSPLNLSFFHLVTYFYFSICDVDEVVTSDLFGICFGWKHDKMDETCHNFTFLPIFLGYMGQYLWLEVAEFRNMKVYSIRSQTIVNRVLGEDCN